MKKHELHVLKRTYTHGSIFNGVILSLIDEVSVKSETSMAQSPSPQYVRYQKRRTWFNNFKFPFRRGIPLQNYWFAEGS